MECILRALITLAPSPVPCLSVETPEPANSNDTTRNKKRTRSVPVVDDDDGGMPSMPATKAMFREEELSTSTYPFDYATKTTGSA